MQEGRVDELTRERVDKEDSPPAVILKDDTPPIGTLPHLVNLSTATLSTAKLEPTKLE